MMSLFAGHQEDGPGEEADAGEEDEGGQEDGPGEEAGDGQEDGQESPRAEQSGLVRGVGQVVRYVQRRAPPFGFVCSSPTRRPGGQSARSRSSFLLHPKGKRHDHRLLFFDVVVQKARTTRSIETTRTRTRKVRAERDKAQEMIKLFPSPSSTIFGQSSVLAFLRDFFPNPKAFIIKEKRWEEKRQNNLFSRRTRATRHASSRATDDALTTSLLSISTHRKILTLLLFLLFCFFCF